MAGQFDWINVRYDLKLRRGTQVIYKEQKGRVVSAEEGQYVNIKLDGEKKIIGPFHPRSIELTYLHD
jgi:hypothetical protein